MPTIEDLRYFQRLPLDIKVAMTKTRIREWVNHYGINGVYISFSGGKDNMANVGDKLIVEVKEVASWGKGCEPIYKLKGFDGTFTPHTIDVLPNCEAVYDKGFEHGLEKAWEVAKRIFIPKLAYEKAYKRHELEIIFGKDIATFEFAKLTVFEVVDKVELYEKQKAEKDKIKDGDEVRLDDGTKGVVVFSSTDGHLNIVNAYGSMRSYNATQVVKTGRHFPQMVEMMKEMRDNE